MRYLRYLFLAALAVVLIVLALANRDAVMLNSLPAGLAGAPVLAPFAVSVEVPLFIVILLGIVLGLLIGFAWEWLREHKHRVEASSKASEVKKLERELRRVKGQRDEGKDEVLKLLDEAG